ncbi:TPA: cytochrome c-type biogenesis protein [Haemophilus influenzae]|jgi:putative cytochrome c-type biogenesis protein ccmH|uniref:Cytochrome c-type biogenesis protein n=3 Tax=Haemophilus influenzae TaxID=727 RepID=A0A112VQ29_HAEIF|nr:MULTISPECIES: cytochrome c-type biogenesis protein CcmH [Haemophilus]ADO96634.1 cytochrome c maturation heme lyase subunit CcmH1 [Haemophilus influenzae R2846]AGV11582.1 cytochrome c maturation heme lyase subunit CcmH1 [Haemophilus influenzae KR494]AIT68247.1 cytochrome C biogenesis protein [Haemophilus influenzae]AJO91006.1 Cytochrome c-type biogenesis protein CcmH precursor [Haemophilus influenzae]AXP40559.1 cytochrome c-type biogenesis protein CcmH [Haemophilus influenzae]
MKKTWLFLTAFLFSSVAFSAIDALNFSSPQQESDYHQLTQSLRCPQCQNNNIADSNATIAVDMRGKVFELLQEGKSKNDVVDYMVARYGNFVTYDPPITASTLVLWIAPLLLVLLGVVFLLRRKPKTQSAVKSQEVLTDEDNARLAELLNKDK